MEDTVRIQPHNFGMPFEEVLMKRLNARLTNKIVPDLGLCLFVYDLIEVGVSYVLPGDGSTHTRVKGQLGCELAEATEVGGRFCSKEMMKYDGGG
ncbi:unnamed protein product [Toxocara canis]|uniref:SHS2_Rpb7-N domain-containing protein n=1 Tax=Toxocara canis TaxID=6265 RepID=A0A183U7G4_TOXCA|nr:unnamed protein product [Toxocara canis]